LAIEIILEGILFVLSEGCSWRAIDRPEVSWNSIYQYHRRWCRSGLWAELLHAVGKEAVGTLRFLDSSHVKVHAHGANPAGGQAAQAMGRTKGGLNTKIHALVDNRGGPRSLVLSAGQLGDVTVAPVLLRGLAGGCVIADKAYDSNPFRALLAERAHRACIPSQPRRRREIAYAKATYRKRHRVENFFQKLKRYRRVATRYDKLAETYFGFVLLAALIVELLR
jgi:transposase